MEYGCALSLSDHETLLVSGCTAIVFNHATHYYVRADTQDVCPEDGPSGLGGCY